MNIKDNFVKIPLNGNTYDINLEKLTMVLSYLENKTINIKNEQEISELLNKYSLYDEAFLSSINNI